MFALEIITHFVLFLIFSLPSQIEQFRGCDLENEQAEEI